MHKYETIVLAVANEDLKDVPVSKPKCEHDLADILWSASTHYPKITDYE